LAGRRKGLRESLALVSRWSFGAIEADQVVNYYHLCDLYVHTPRVINLSFEGFGIVYLEAGAAGKAVVAADAGGIRDAVIDGQTGLIARNEDANDIADKIITLLDNEALRKQIGEAGRRYAQQHDWSIIADKFIDVYKKYNENNLFIYENPSHGPSLKIYYALNKFSIVTKSLYIFVC